MSTLVYQTILFTEKHVFQTRNVYKTVPLKHKTKVWKLIVTEIFYIFTFILFHFIPYIIR